MMPIRPSVDPVAFDINSFVIFQTRRNHFMDLRKYGKIKSKKKILNGLQATKHIFNAMVNNSKSKIYNKSRLKNDTLKSNLNIPH